METEYLDLEMGDQNGGFKIIEGLKL